MFEMREIRPTSKAGVYPYEPTDRSEKMNYRVPTPKEADSSNAKIAGITYKDHQHAKLFIIIYIDVKTFRAITGCT